MKFDTILIIDDSSTSRMIIQRCFEMAGYSAKRFLFAEDGLEGLAIVKSESGISLIITDINMPKMDGPTFIRMMKKEHNGMSAPVCVVSSISDGTVEEELRSFGIFGVIKKPITPAKIRQLLGGDDD